MTPRISILMAVYNQAETLAVALESLWQQTFTDFEVIVVEDGSSDESPAILARQTDPRLRVFANEKNSGLAASLNRAVAHATGEFIARMDGDDISEPARLATQFNFLRQHPHLAGCGTWVQTFGSREEIWQFPTEPDVIRCELLFENVLAHGSMMLRRAALDEHSLRYEEDLTRAQDYDLWVRLARQAPLANIPRPLVCYRLHGGQAGAADSVGQQDTAQKVRRMQLEWLGLAPRAEELALHLALSTAQFEPTPEFLAQGRAWLEGLAAANQRARLYPRRALQQSLARRWLAACRAAQGLGWVAWRAYAGSRLARPSVLAARFFLLCLRAEVRRG